MGKEKIRWLLKRIFVLIVVIPWKRVTNFVPIAGAPYQEWNLLHNLLYQHRHRRLHLNRPLLLGKWPRLRLRLSLIRRRSLE